MSGSIERIRITYVLTAAAGDDPAALAQDVAYEQTVEVPRETLRPDLAARVPGRVERIERRPDGRAEAVISYDPLVAGPDPLQLVNLVFGNISMKAGIRVTGLELPPRVLERLRGPKFGIPGLRELCGAGEGRPLVCVAVKPLGLSAAELAALCGAFAEAGVDVVKDDHGVTDQPTAPFRERVPRCAEAVERANARTGGHCRYFPNVTAGPAELAERLELARTAGCRGVLVLPLLTGLETPSWIADRFGMAVLGHPALAGAFFGPDHGIAPAVLLGLLFRLLGVDGVLYPNVGGRFPITDADCEAINAALRRPLGAVRPAFPVPGGGVDAARIAHWRERYGPDTMFLVGSSLYAQPDPVAAARRLVDALR